MTEPQDVPAELLRPLEDRIAETVRIKAEMLAGLHAQEPEKPAKRKG